MGGYQLFSSPDPPHAGLCPTGPLHSSGLLWEFTSLGASNATLKSVVDSIIARHRDARLPSSIQGHMSYTRLTCCLARVLSRPHNHKMGVTRDMVVFLLCSTPTDLLAFSNKNAVNTLTTGCMLPAEGAAALTCELVFN